MQPGRSASRLAVAAQVAALVVALAAPSAAAAATLDFTLQTPSVATVAYSDMVTFRGTYTCVNDAASTCPTTMQTQTATFSLRPSGGSTFTTVGTVASTFVFTANPAGCTTTCAAAFQLVWRSGRIGTTTVPPGTYDIGLSTTIGPGQLVSVGGLTITTEGTTTTYAGGTSGLGNTTLALSGSVLDHDRGLSPGTGIISPDANLAGAGVVTFALYDATNTTLVAGPVSANLSSAGAITGSPSLLLPAAGGSFRLRTTYAGNAFYDGSADLDTITVAPSNTPPVLVLPAAPVVVEATSPLGAAADFAVSATDLEDDPDPNPTCSHTSGSTFPVGSTTVTCSVVDSGGLNDTDTFLVQVVDTTDPFVAITTAESAAGTGWYNAASNDGVPGVTVDVTTGDLVGVTGLRCKVDGVDVGPLDPSGDSFVVLDGSHAVQCEASDESGNLDTTTAGFDVDQTAPSIVPSVSPAAAASGWWNAATGAPTATFTCSDATSGVIDCADAYTFGEGVDQSISGSASDAAGNTAFAAVTDIDVDLTGPSRVSFVGGGLANNGSYPYLFVPAGPTSCGALDTGSGVARCVVSGYAATVGSHAIVGAATDVAGNVGAGSLTYTVEPWKLAGFGKPVDMVGFNALKAGGSTNLKFEVFAGATELTAAQVVASVDDEQIGCSASSGPAPKTKGPGPKKPRAGVDSVGGHLSIRWDSPDLPGTCWRVTLRTLDGSLLSASFKLR